MPFSINLLQRWFELAALAPSGANLQPWSYSSQAIENGCQIRLQIDPKYLLEPSSLDPYFVAVNISIGAFAKNLEIAAANDGFQLSKLKTNGNTPETWFWELHFTLSENKPANFVELESAIKTRVSNRNLYRQDPLNDHDWETTNLVLKKYSDFKLVRIHDNKKDLIKILSQLEKIRCQDTQLCAEMFKEFSTEKELKKNPTGLPFKTISSSPLERGIIFLLKKWPALQSIFKYGADYFFINSSVRKPIIHSGDVLILQGSKKDSLSGFEMGQLLEELWLQWTVLDLSAQLLALPLLIHGQSRLPQLQNRLNSIQELANKTYAIDLSLPTLVIRIGRSNKKALPSPRHKVNQESLI